MKVDQHNYQAYILDYFEGTLSAQEREELLSFLNAHPEFRKEFEEYEHISLNDLSDDESFFSGKSELKKNTELSQEVLFDYTEGHLSPKEKEEAEKVLNGNENLKRELKLWQMAKAEPDLSVGFPFKERLKKRRAVVVPLWHNVYMRAAAVIALFLGAGWIFFGRESGSAEAMSLAELKDHAVFTKTAVVKNQTVNQQENNSAVKNFVAVQTNNNKKQFNVLPEIKDTIRTVIVNNTVLKQDSALALKKLNTTKNDSAFSVLAIRNSVDSLNNKIVRGTWKQEPKLPVEKRSLKKKMLDVAVTCLRGLHVIGVKKVDAVKQVNPDNGNTGYILVMGDKSYSTMK